MSGQRFCLECGEPLVGRSDKKFCSDYCRNAYNNRKNREVNEIIRLTHQQLRKNRKILAELNPEGKKVKIRKQTLINKGFDFRYITEIYRTKKGSIYYYVYDYAYLYLDDHTLMLMKKLEPGQ